MAEKNRTASLVELRDRAKRGNERSLVALLRRMRPAINARIRSSRPAANGFIHDDLRSVAEARLAVNLHSSRAETEGEFITWAMAVIRSAILDAVTSRYARESRELVPHHRLDAPAVPLEGGVDAPAPREEVLTCLRRAYERLPNRTQLILWERLVNRLTWAEVGETFGISGAAAKRRYQRAISRLRKAVLKCIRGLPPSARERALAEIGYES